MKQDAGQVMLAAIFGFFERYIFVCVDKNKQT